MENMIDISARYILLSLPFIYLVKMLINKNKLNKALTEKIKSLEKSLSENETNKINEVKDNEKKLNDYQNKINKLKSDIKTKDDEINKFNENIKSKDNEISKLNENIELKNNEINKLNKGIQLKDNEISKR